MWMCCILPRIDRLINKQKIYKDVKALKHCFPRFGIYFDEMQLFDLTLNLLGSIVWFWMSAFFLS